ncbi:MULTISPECIES: MgtC/SapB family protein [unclassified Sulfitobacter]|uniref:MgtC/SapB family protein n=1 Tax=unclassified Sulfitobacter TaxID=196795 RepID=UPI00083684BE|nr:MULTISPECIES: MgtC/SapB family protein [unclassified Sulfitobacter]
MENDLILPIGLGAATFNLFLALVCGGLIGSERQVRQRMAGLRTNALVALGAASFVVFSSLYPDELSPTRVGAQVVSGIGFLGAGIIFRHGFTVHGLNTAATLWCSASVGLLAGASAPLFAVMATGMIVFVNLGLRPLVKLIKAKTSAGLPLTMDARITVTCRPKDEADVRSLLLAHLVPPIFRLEGLDRSQEEGKGPITLEVSVEIQGESDAVLRRAVEPLLLDTKIMNLSWDTGGDR